MATVPVADVLEVLKQLSHDIRGGFNCWSRDRCGVLPHHTTRRRRRRRRRRHRPLTRPPASPTDLDVGTSVDRHQKLPVVQFLRDYVAASKPVVLTSEWRVQNAGRCSAGCFVPRISVPRLA